VDHAVLHAVLDARDEPGIHAVAPLRKVLRVVAGLVSAPETTDQVVRVGEAGLDLLDHAAELAERTDRLSDQGGDLGVHRESTQVGGDGYLEFCYSSSGLVDVIVWRGLARGG